MMVEPKLNLLEGFKNLMVLLKMLGCWYYPKEPIYKIYKNFIVITGILYTITGGIFSYKNTHSDKTMESFFVTVGAFEAVTKSLLFRKNFEIIRESWRQIQQDGFQPRNDEQKKLLKNYTKMAKLIFRVYFGVYVWCVGGMVMVSVITGEDFPSNHWIPFDYQQFYQILYIYVMVALQITSFSNCALDSCFFLSLLHLVAQCDLLTNTVRNIHDLKKLNKDTKNRNHDEVMNDVLIECVKHYQLILKYYKVVSNGFKEIITFQFIPSTALICIAMFKLSTMSPGNTLYLKIFFFQFGAITEIFFYCFFGNLVTTTSQKLFYAAFESEWYNSSQKFKKNLLTFMMTVQEPIIFYSWNIFAVNYEAFKSIMQKSWSIVVALKSTQDM